MGSSGEVPPATEDRWIPHPTRAHVLIGPDGSIVVGELFKARYGRFGVEPPNVADVTDTRTETERDRGRLSYSTHLRRLAGVTQVVSPDLHTSQLHSRASHSYKVALIAREIAENLTRKARQDDSLMDEIVRHGGLDIAACEAAGLAHDLGHPPFGHVGEEVLDRELRGDPGLWDGFEGNAQSFRIVTSLAHQKAEGEEPGLGLTNVTLAAILKYPFSRDTRATPDHPHGRDSQKFGAYATEGSVMRGARDAVLPVNTDADYLSDKNGPKPHQSLEASIMDLADDIAYSIHDLEDFCAQGTIDLRLVHAELDRAVTSLLNGRNTSEDTNVFVVAATELAKEYPAFFDKTAYNQALSSAVSTFSLVMKTQTQTSPGLFEGTLREQLSIIVNEFFEAIRCDGDANLPPVHLEQAAWHKMQVLKRVTKRYLVNTSTVGQIQRAQVVAMERLFQGTVTWVETAPSTSVLPVKLQEIMANAGLDVAKHSADKQLVDAHYRAIADYICTMSDSEAFEVSQWLAGATVPGTSFARCR